MLTANGRSNDRILGQIFLVMRANSFWRYGLGLVSISLAVLGIQLYLADPGLYIPNIEATWHALHIVNSLTSDSALHHYLLPSVTLGNNFDRWVSWGVAAPTPSGNLIYTSFYSPAFIVASLSTSLHPFLDSFHSLVLVNEILGAATALTSYLLTWTVLGALELSPGRRAISAFLGGGLIALLSRETLVSHGMVYWPHSLYQLFLGANLIVLYKLLAESATGKKPTKILCAALFLLSYAGGLIEWTGIVFPLLASLVTSLSPKLRHTRIPVILLMAAIVSAVTIAAHFSIALGPGEFISTSLSRFATRSSTSSTLFLKVKALASGYILSFGPWLLVCAVSSLLVGIRRLRAALAAPAVALILLLSLLPLVENLLLLGHASQFSFDRLKAIFPVGIYLSTCLSIGLSKGPELKRRILILAILAASGISVLQYQLELKQARDFAPVHASNLKLVEDIKNSTELSCVSISSSMLVRGYDNVLFMRAIHELKKTPRDAWGAMKRYGGCGSVWVDGFRYSPDIPSYQRAVVMLPNGSSRELRTLGH